VYICLGSWETVLTRLYADTTNSDI